MIINFLVVLILTLIDQISKIIITKNLQIHESIPVIKDFFHFTYVRNKGVAFGMFFGNVPFFIIIGVIAIIGIVLYLHKKNEEYSWLSRFGFLFILSGAIGNWIDRVFRGFVVDFLDFKGIWQYIFNFADVFINIGVILIIIEYFFEKEKVEKEESSI